jgi:pimeloyl-ACP methyl ester carboxylesterase
MHGGGGAPTAVNDRQWTNQISLYKLEEGIYVAPRAPTDNWNLWHEAHIDPMFDRLIEDYVALRGVDPDRVYLMGYSAGGDGVWQLAPRMADRFAAAAMMAGHPNDASLLGLRNLPFAVFVGGEDSAYDRNKVVAERAKQLDDLQAADPEGYIHMSRVYPGLPHWMQHKDAEAIPWMAKYSRNPWPRKIVWRQSTVTHDRFYWLSIPKDAAKPNQQITAEIGGQTIHLSGDVPNDLRLRLSDKLVDLDKPIRVLLNDREVANEKCPRTADAIRESLAERADPNSAATAIMAVHTTEH